MDATTKKTFIINFMNYHQTRNNGWFTFIHIYQSIEHTTTVNVCQIANLKPQDCRTATITKQITITIHHSLSSRNVISEGQERLNIYLLSIVHL